MPCILNEIHETVGLSTLMFGVESRYRLAHNKKVFYTKSEQKSSGYRLDKQWKCKI